MAESEKPSNLVPENPEDANIRNSVQTEVERNSRLPLNPFTATAFVYERDESLIVVLKEQRKLRFLKHCSYIFAFFWMAHGMVFFHGNVSRTELGFDAAKFALGSFGFLLLLCKCYRVVMVNAIVLYGVSIASICYYMNQAYYNGSHIALELCRSWEKKERVQGSWSLSRYDNEHWREHCVTDVKRGMWLFIFLLILMSIFSFTTTWSYATRMKTKNSESDKVFPDVEE